MCFDLNSFDLNTLATRATLCTEEQRTNFRCFSEMQWGRLAELDDSAWRRPPSSLGRAPRGVEVFVSSHDIFKLHLEDLPLEMLARILGLVDSPTLLSCRLVSRRLCRAATDDDVWRHRCVGPLPMSSDRRVWSFFLLYWSRQKKDYVSEETLQQMVAKWTK